MDAPKNTASGAWWGEGWVGGVVWRKAGWGEEGGVGRGWAGGGGWGGGGRQSEPSEGTPPHSNNNSWRGNLCSAFRNVLIRVALQPK